MYIFNLENENYNSWESAKRTKDGDMVVLIRDCFEYKKGTAICAKENGIRSRTTNQWFKIGNKKIAYTAFRIMPYYVFRSKMIESALSD